jgi:urease subunit gamma/beta
VHLTPHEQERLLIYVAADVALKRKGRGTPLNYPEAVAVITAHVLEEARDGQKTVAQLMGSVAPSVLDYPDLLPGVAEMLSGIQIEATFPDGTKMVSIRHPLPPITPQPTPPTGAQAGTQPASPAAPMPWVHPGKVYHPVGAARIEHNKKVRPSLVTVTVTNTDDRAIQVGSHFHFFEANPLLDIAEGRDKAYGKRLNVPAGNSVRFEPECPLRVELVDIAGARIVMGLNGKVGGTL